MTTGAETAQRLSSKCGREGEDCRTHLFGGSAALDRRVARNPHPRRPWTWPRLCAIEAARRAAQFPPLGVLMRSGPVARVSALLVVLPLVAVSPASADLVARWSFDDGSESATASDSISGFDGTLSGNVSLTDSGGISGGAVEFAAESPGIVNMGDVLAFTGSEGFTIQAWLKTTQTNGALVAGRHVATVVAGYFLALNDVNDGPPNEAAGSFHLYQSDASTTNTGAQGINDGQWHQIVAVRDDSANQIRLYVDGVRKPDASSTGALNPLGATSAPFLVGGAIFGVTPTGGYVGQIDELRVWDDPLSDAEVKFFFDHPDSPNTVLCGDANRSLTLTASDGQLALRVAVGTAECLDCICDANGVGGVTASDALLILRRAVGQDVTMDCPVCIAGNLDGLRWEIPCTNSGTPVCTSNNEFSETATMLGDPGSSYDVTLRFRGVIEQKTYSGGVKDGYFLTGGTPAADGYNIYRLEISDPPSVYYLNAGTSNIQRVWELDVTKTIPIAAGATVTLSADAEDGFIIANTDGSGQPIIPAGVPPAPNAFPGQFIQMDVVSVEEAD